MTTELELFVATPDEQRHHFTLRVDEPLQRLADDFFSHARHCGLRYSARAFCLSLEGEPMDYALASDELGLEHGVEGERIPRRVSRAGVRGG